MWQFGRAALSRVTDTGEVWVIASLYEPDMTLRSFDNGCTGMTSPATLETSAPARDVSGAATADLLRIDDDDLIGTHGHFIDPEKRLRITMARQ